MPLDFRLKEKRIYLPVIRPHGKMIFGNMIHCRMRGQKKPIFPAMHEKEQLHLRLVKKDISDLAIAVRKGNTKIFGSTILRWINGQKKLILRAKRVRAR